MKYLRTYADSEGESHFEDVEPALTPRVAAPGSTPMVLRAPAATSPESAAPWLRSAPIPAEHLTFSRSRAGGFRERGPSPRRVFIFTIEGEIEIETSDGETRRLGPGSLWPQERRSEWMRRGGHRQPAAARYADNRIGVD